jgi:hypothetical protein
MSGTPSARLPEGHPLVLSRSGEAMSERAYQQRMKEIVAEAGTIRRFRTYVRYQRNRYIETLIQMNFSPREIKEKLERQLCEKISIRNILRIAKKR